jgi:F-type H+-transporting ATPase subunit delta
MGSATRSALAEARGSLAAASGVDLTVGAQLLAAARVIGNSSQLQSALLDSSAPASAKSGLIGGVFSNLGDTARALLQGIGTSRWSNRIELLGGIEEIGIRAVAQSSTEVDALVGELFSFGRAASSDAELELAIGSKRGSAESKLSLITALVGARGSAQAVAILSHLVQQPRGRRIGELLSSTAAIVADAADKGVATVTVARPLTSAQTAAVQQAITGRYGREHVLNQVIDSDIVGGVRVQVGDEVIDGSVAARLAELRLRLAG